MIFLHYYSDCDMNIRLQIASIEVNLIAFSVAYVWRSKGEIDQI